MLKFSQFFNEAFDDDEDIHHHIKDFAGKPGEEGTIKNHPRYSTNPLTRMHGGDLIRAGAEDYEEKRNKAGVPKQGVMRYAMNLLHQIIPKEQRHKAELEKLAIKLASKHTGFPEELMHAKLSTSLIGGKYSQSQGVKKQPDPSKMMELNKDVKDNIAKRENLRILSQGHALSTMDALHMEEKEELQKVDPEISELYKKLSLATKGTYLHTDSVARFVNEPELRGGHAVGEVYLENNPQTGQLEIYASAVTFPFLVQELVKGCMEFTARHSYGNMDDKMMNTVVHHTNNSEDEPYQFLMGPQLWNYLRMVTPKEWKKRIMYVVMELSQLPAREFNDFLRHLVEDMTGPEKASPRSTNFIQDLMDDYEQRHG